MAGLPLLERVAPGDHICWLVDDDRARLDGIAGFVQAGLRTREKVIYSGDAPEEILAAVTGRGVSTQEALRTGQLIAESPEASYLAGGTFDAEATSKIWRGATAQARAEGYTGLRVIGDMSWALRRVPGAERLLWYESAINTNFIDGNLIGVCAYDPRRFDRDQLRKLICAHPGAATATTPYDPSTSLRIRRTCEPYGLRLSGEADLSNREALSSVIEEAVAERDITVDVTDLRFADMAAARILINAAAAGPCRLRLTGCGPTLLRLLGFHDADAVPGLTVEART